MSFYCKNRSVSSISLSSSSGGDGPDMDNVGSPKWSSSNDILSTLLALRHNFDTEPCLRKNSFESKPGPLFDTKMAELMRGRCFLGGL